MIGSILLGACIIDYASRDEVSKTSAATITPEFRPTQVGFVPGDPTSTPPGWDFDDPLFQEGQAIIWDGEPETVLEVMNDVIDRFPGFAPAYWHRGMAYWKLDKCELGLEDMERALSIDPYYALAWADRGLLHYCLGNDIAAVQDSLRALELDPSLAKVHSRFGSDAYNRGDYLGAIQEYDIALSIDPTRKLSWAYRG